MKMDIDDNGDIKIRYWHNKLIDLTTTIKPNSILMQCRGVQWDDTLLWLFTNFHFVYEGEVVPDTESICKFINVNDKKVHTLQIKLIPYDECTAKYHLMKIQEIIQQPQLYQMILANKKQTNKQSDYLQEQLTSITKKVYQPINIKHLEDYNHSSFLFEMQNQSNQVELLQFLTISGFNPPPESRKLDGDLFYLQLKTLQNNQYHITASPLGFFINQSKTNHFNPQISGAYKSTYVNLIDLISCVSQKFRICLEQLTNNFDYNEFRHHSWSKSTQINKRRWLDKCEHQHYWNNKKAMKQLNQQHKIQANQDWDESFQAINDLKFFGDQIYYYSSRNKLYYKFQQSAIRGAKLLIDGKISPLNPFDQKKKQIYIYNRIFFSIAGEDIYNHAQEKGEEAAPSSSAINTDLINLQIVTSLKIPQLHVLHMVVVNYRGFKVIAQCIIPGILSAQHNRCCQYGSIDDGKTIGTNKQFNSLIVQICDKLGLDNEIEVRDGQGTLKTIALSPDIKGIMSSTNKKYVLDLLRISPRDLNYQGIENQTCVLRPQLLKKFKQLKSQEQINIPKINVNIGTDIIFEKNDKTEKQIQLLKQIASFLLTSAIPQLIDQLKIDGQHYLTDSWGISQAFHKNGVNMRYLGYVYGHQLLKDNLQILVCLKRIILVKSLKVLFKMVMRQTNIMHLGHALAHILNSIFGRKKHLIVLQQNSVKQQQVKTEPKQSKKKKKKKNKQTQLQNFQQIDNPMEEIKVKPSAYISMKPSELWAIVLKISKARYNHELLPSIIQFNENDIFSMKYQKIATLRNTCMAIGLVLERKKYDIIEVQNSVDDKILPFEITNIVDLQAISKKGLMECQSAVKMQEEGDLHLSHYKMQQALASYGQAMSFLLSIKQTKNMTRVCSKRAKIMYLMGSYAKAMELQLDCLYLNEKMLQVDTYQVIQSYSKLGLYSISFGDQNLAKIFLFKSFYLMLMSFGQNYPQILICLINIARVYQQNKQILDSMNCYLRAIEIITTVNNKNHINVSFCFSSLASLSYEQKNMKKAVFYQNQSVLILQKILPQEDSRLADAGKILRVYQNLGSKKIVDQKKH